MPQRVSSVWLLLTGLLRKLAGADGQHSSRFRALDGRRASATLLPSFVLALARRITGHENGPWLTDAAAARLEGLLCSDSRVLELGSGESSVWLALQVRELHSIETDSAWFSYVQELIDAEAIDNLQLEYCDIADLASLLNTLPKDCYSVIVVDHADCPSFTRSDSLYAVRPLLAPGGHLLLDDSDRPSYSEALGSYDPWPRTDVYGFKSRPLRLTRSTFVRRPSS